MTIKRAKIVGWGHALPAALVMSETLEETHGLKTGSLRAATGVRSRYVANRQAQEDQICLGVRAAKASLARAGLAAGDIDLILSASAVPAQLIPSTAPLYQRGLGLDDGAVGVMDVNTTCLSALSALDLASAYIETGRAKRALIVSSELATTALPWHSSPETAALFGDGAAAWVVEGGEGEQGFYGADFQSYSSAFEACQLPVGGTALSPHVDPTGFMEKAYFTMTGDALFKLVRTHFSDFLDQFLARLKWRRSDVDFFIPHQASPLSLLHMARSFQVGAERYIDISRTHGNQIAASLPTAFSIAKDEGRLPEGARVLLLGTSAGVQFGAAAMVV